MPITISETYPPKHPYERHLSAVICCDRSGSMRDEPIRQLNEAMKYFGTELGEDSLSQGRIDVSIISFGSDVTTDMGFRSAEEYQAPTFTASGGTSMNQAINEALDALEARKAEYKQLGMTYYRPWLFVFTDGYATDGHLEASTKARLQDYIERKKVLYIPMGLGKSADINALQSYYPFSAEAKPVLKCEPGALKDAFKWLSDSMSITSKSDPNLGSIQSAPLPTTIPLAL